MKTGVVNSADLDVGNLSAANYLDKCRHCGGRQADRNRHDVYGRCHRRVFVTTGTVFENRSRS